jgi:aquaporin Z
MKKPLAEALGTFCLVFVGTGAIIVNHITGGAVTHVGVSLTFGLVVMAMIYAVGDISGAHLNPAVSLGFAVARRFPIRELPGYWLAQIGGALAASLFLRALFRASPTLGETMPAGPAWVSFALELVLTFMLMFVILSVSSGPAEKGFIAAIAVGGTIAMEALFAGPICGASMNPARSLAPAFVSGHLQFLWIYLSAPFLGAALSVPVRTILQ